MMKKIENQILIIFGASGDLTKRMLLPSLFELFVRRVITGTVSDIGDSPFFFHGQEFPCAYKRKVKGIRKGEREDR